MLNLQASPNEILVSIVERLVRRIGLYEAAFLRLVSSKSLLRPRGTKEKRV